MSRSITENCVSHIEERGKIAPPSAHHKWIECYFKLLLCVAKPYIGEVARRDGGVKQYNRTIFLTPLLRNYRSFGLSPIFCTTQGRKSNTNSSNKIEYSPLSLPCPVALQGVAKQHREKRLLFNPLPLCSCKEYRGSARRARGLKRLYNLWWRG